MKLAKVLVLQVLLTLWACAPAIAAEQEVTIAYQDMMVPWRYAQQADELARATGYVVHYRKFSGGGDVIRAMASGAVQIGEAGSSPVAAGLSQGLNLKVFWILDNIANAEALVVRNGSGVDSVAQLRGKRLGVPFVSTSHFSALLALEKAGVRDNELRVLNMRPPEIAAAWMRGDIDAAFVWNPVLARLQKDGKVILTAGQLAEQTGKATFDTLVVDANWATTHRDFLVAMVKLLAKGDADYRREPAAWAGTTPKGRAIAQVSGGEAADVADTLKLYQFPSADEQASARWLGGDINGGVAKSLAATAAFLKTQNSIQAVLPDYSAGVTPEYVKAAISK